MSRQLLLESFFNKSKGSTSKSNLIMTDNDKKGKKRSLSLIKSATPTKSPKGREKQCNVHDVVNLISDEDEDNASCSPKLNIPCVDLSQRSNESEVSDTSIMTIPYSLTPETLAKAPQAFGTPLKTPPTQQIQVTSWTTPKTLQTPQQTPRMTKATPQSHTQSFCSPKSREKFYSPTKNRSVVKRIIPAKVKRSLSMEMSNTEPNFVEDMFTAACKDMDDKTVFLLTIINKFLNDASLRHLLGSESQELLSNCLQVVKPGMRLVCRLYWRKKDWYKMEQVHQISCETKEKESLDDLSLRVMLESLEKSGLVVKGDNSSTCFDDFKTILNKEELMQICKELKLKTTSKQHAIAALASFSKRTSNMSNFLTGYTSNNAKRVLQLMSQKAGPCYRLSDLASSTFHKLHILMYLGMDYNAIREKKLELTLLYDKIQRQTFPVDKAMPLDNASVVFRNKDDFERYVYAHNIYEDFLTRTDEDEKCAIVKQVHGLYKDIGPDDMMCYKSPPVWLRRYTPAYLYVKILEAGIQDLKKDKDGGHYLLALDILSTLINQNTFRQHKKAEWYSEKALILHSLLYRYDEAAEVLLEGFKSNMTEEAKDSMRPRASKIANQKNATLSDHLKIKLRAYASKENILEKNLGGEHIYKQPMDRTHKRGKVKFETRTTEGRMVQEAEEYCIGHYITCGEMTDGEHWEGRIVTTIFFLLFWDIIYSKPPGVRGVFLSYYQMYPLDMFCEGFYANRKKAIDDWLEVIEKATEDKLLKIMQDTWNKRPEHELSGICRLGWDNIRMVASCLGPRGLAAVCRRLAQNYHYTNSGFPDLTLWNKHTKEIKFVEVKTDTDKPSMKQIQWMNYLRENGIGTHFCYLGANTTRQRCRMADRPAKKEPKRRIKKEPKKMKIKKETGENVIIKQEIVKEEPQESVKMEFVVGETQPNVEVKLEPADIVEVVYNSEMKVKEENKNTIEVEPKGTKPQGKVIEGYETKIVMVHDNMQPDVIVTVKCENKNVVEQVTVNEECDNNIEVNNKRTEHQVKDNGESENNIEVEHTGTNPRVQDNKEGENKIEAIHKETEQVNMKQDCVNNTEVNHKEPQVKANIEHDKYKKLLVCKKLGIF